MGGVFIQQGQGVRTSAKIKIKLQTQGRERKRKATGQGSHFGKHLQSNNTHSTHTNKAGVVCCYKQLT